MEHFPFSVVMSVSVLCQSIAENFLFLMQLSRSEDAGVAPGIESPREDSSKARRSTESSLTGEKLRLRADT